MILQSGWQGLTLALPGSGTSVDQVVFLTAIRQLCKKGECARPRNLQPPSPGLSKYLCKYNIFFFEKNTHFALRFLRNFFILKA